MVPIRSSCPASARVPSVQIHPCRVGRRAGRADQRDSRSKGRWLLSCADELSPGACRRGCFDDVRRVVASAGVAMGEIAAGWSGEPTPPVEPDGARRRRRRRSRWDGQRILRCCAGRPGELADRGRSAEIASSAEALRGALSLQPTPPSAPLPAGLLSAACASLSASGHSRRASCRRAGSTSASLLLDPAQPEAEPAAVEGQAPRRCASCRPHGRGRPRACGRAHWLLASSFRSPSGRPSRAESVKCRYDVLDAECVPAGRPGDSSWAATRSAASARRQ